MGWRAHQEHGDGGRDEGRGVEGKRGACADAGHQRTAEGRSGEAQRNRPDELVERVGGREVGGRDDVRDDCLEGRREEGGADPVEGDKDHEFPEGEEACQGEDGEGGDDYRTADVRAQHERTPVETVAEDPGRQEKDDCRDRHADPE